MCGVGVVLLPCLRTLCLSQWQCLNVYQSEWLGQREALARLGMSRATLHRLRAGGVIRDGVHVHRIGPGRRAPLRINVPACVLALQVHTAAMRAETVR
jgi:hypothetical protein